MCYAHSQPANVGPGHFATARDEDHFPKTLAGFSGGGVQPPRPRRGVVGTTSRHILGYAELS